MTVRADLPSPPPGRAAPSHAVLIGLAVVCSSFPACASSRPDPAEQVAVTITPPAAANAAEPGKMTLGELDQLTYAFADRYFMTISSAVDQLKFNNPDAEQRRAAHRMKVIGVLAMNDIASAQDPYSQVLNLLVAVTLQARVWIDEGRAETVFGERAPILIQAMIEIRRDAWRLAERVMSPDQMERLELMITAWRRKHPQQDQVAFVKFDEFATSKATNLAKEMSSSGGLLAPLDDANRELVEYRRLAERAFWYTKRAPSIAGIQAEAATNEIMASPEISQLFENVDQITATAGQVGKVVTTAAEHGPQIAATTHDMMASVTGIVRETRLTIAQAETTLKTLHDLYPQLLEAKPDSGPPGRPFNIVEYTAALHATANVLKEANQLAGQSPAASALVTRHLDQAAAFTDARLDRIFTLVWITLGIVFGGIVGTVAILRRLRRTLP